MDALGRRQMDLTAGDPHLRIPERKLFARRIKNFVRSLIFFLKALRLLAIKNGSFLFYPVEK
jgi:hypothetical protein